MELKRIEQPWIITSNLCDALIRMHGSRDKGMLGLDITWASNPNIPLPEISNRVVFRTEYFRTIEQIGKALRPKKEAEESQEFLGTVETLNGDVGEDGRRSGEVMLALLLPDEGVVRARVVLGAEEYALAVKAHELGRGYIMVRGVLYRDSRIGYIREAGCFRLVDPVPQK